MQVEGDVERDPPADRGEHAAGVPQVPLRLLEALVVESELVRLEAVGHAEASRVEEPSTHRAQLDVQPRGRANVGKVLVDQAEPPFRWDAGEQIACAEVDLGLALLVEMGEDVPSGDREALLEEIGDDKGGQVKDLRAPSASRPFPVPMMRRSRTCMRPASRANALNASLSHDSATDCSTGYECRVSSSRIGRRTRRAG